VNESLIHAAVAAQAARDPEATALVWHDRTMSYGMLDAAANDYAADLADRGVGPGQIVPFLMDRSPEMVALQLAVLKTGAAYANVDPNWPAERRRLILDLIAPTLAVTADHRLNGRIASYQPADDGIAGAARRARRFDPVPVSPEVPATVFFTSGTTGIPKGVLSPHQAVTRMFGPQGLPGFGPGHATPQVAALPWDMYAFELWGQLTTGGTVVLIPGSYLLPNMLRDLVATRGVDTLWLTAAVLNLFLDEDPDCFSGLAHVITGGETASPEHLRGFLRRYPDIALWNAYGPAESCMISTIAQVTPADCDRPGGVPIGTPVPDTTVVLLDEAGRPCPPGQEGEICISGRGLATGYLGQPDLTREKFPDLDLDGRPVRIYRTGDLGVLDDVGVLHYRGRRDRQIKISGLRIELAEIESAAASLPGVRNCLAFPIDGPDGTADRLALVYLVPRADAVPPGTGDGDPLDVHAQLSRLLPAYMVPPVVRGLQQYPMTANGKVDTRALRELVRHSRPAGRGRVAHR
jgi:amino acid adenylation domain-containing protein